MSVSHVQGGLAGVLSLLEGDEFVRGILEPAGLTMDDLARPSIVESEKTLNVPPPTDGAIPSKRAPRWVQNISILMRAPEEPSYA